MFTIDEFIEAKKIGAPHAGRKGSPLTLKTYRMALINVERLLGKPLAECVEDDGHKFVHEAHRKYSQASINQMLAALNGAFTWAIGTRQYDGVNPFVHIVSNTPERKIPTILSVEQMKKLFEVIERESGRKYTLIFSLMGYSGLRINEALTLRKKDILDDGILIVGKGNKPAYVPVKPQLLKELKSYVKDHPKTDYVFYGEDRGHINRPLQSPHCYFEFDKALALAELPTDITPHNLRHSFATHALHKTRRIEIVQDLLRHKNINTTRFYAQVSPDELKKEHAKIFS